MGLRGRGGGVKNKVWIGIQDYKACTVGVLFRDCEFMCCSQLTLLVCCSETVSVTLIL